MSTRWRPNTCGCELIFNNGPENPPDHITKCKDHKEDNGSVVWSENQGLNRTLGILEKMGLDPTKIEWEFDKKGRGRRTLKIHIPPGLGVVFDPRDIKHIEIVLE